MGVNVIGKARHVLGARTPQPPSTWVRAPGAFRPLVSAAAFEAARRRFRVNKPIVSEAVLLAELAEALRRNGRLSRGIIDRDPQTHCASVYQYRFGNLSTAYARIGYEMTAQQAATSAAAFRDKPHLKQGRPRKVPDDVVLELLAEVLARHGYLSKELIGVTPGIPHSHALARRFGGLAALYDRLGYQPSPRQLLGMRTGATRRRDADSIAIRAPSDR